MIANWTPAGFATIAAPQPQNRPKVSLAKRYVYRVDRVNYSEGFRPPPVPTFKKETDSE